MSALVRALRLASAVETLAVEAASYKDRSLRLSAALFRALPRSLNDWSAETLAELSAD